MSPARAEDGLLGGAASLRLRRAMVTARRQTVEVVLVRSMVIVVIVVIVFTYAKGQSVLTGGGDGRMEMMFLIFHGECRMPPDLLGCHIRHEEEKRLCESFSEMSSIFIR